MLGMGSILPEALPFGLNRRKTGLIQVCFSQTGSDVPFPMASAHPPLTIVGRIVSVPWHVRAWAAAADTGALASGTGGPYPYSGRLCFRTPTSIQSSGLVTFPGDVFTEQCPPIPDDRPRPERDCERPRVRSGRYDAAVCGYLRAPVSGWWEADGASARGRDRRDSRSRHPGRAGSAHR